MEAEKNKETTFLGTLSSHIMKISEYNRLKNSGIPQNEAMKVVTASPFLWKLNRMDEQAKNFNSRNVKKALSMLIRTESTLKKSGIDNKLLMELMLPFIMPKRSKTHKQP